MAVSKGLGKGLSALLGDEILDEKSTNEIDIYDISPNPNQPRHFFDEEALTELSENIKENGVITLCLTDHFWDEDVPGASSWYSTQNYDHIAKALPLPKADGIR